MKAQKTLLIALSLLLVTSSCAWFKPVPVPVPIFIESSIPVREHPKPLNLLVPKLYVVSDKNLEKFLADNKKRNNGVVFIAMDIRDYETSAFNFAEIDRYIKQLLAVINYYEQQIAIREDITDEVPKTK